MQLQNLRVGLVLFVISRSILLVSWLPSITRTARLVRAFALHTPSTDNSIAPQWSELRCLFRRPEFVWTVLTRTLICRVLSESFKKVNRPTRSTAFRELEMIEAKILQPSKVSQPADQKIENRNKNQNEKCWVILGWFLGHSGWDGWFIFLRGARPTFVLIQIVFSSGR